MRISFSTVRNYEKTGILHGVIDKHGQHWFLPDEVRRAVRPRVRIQHQSPEGEIQATVIEMLEDKIPITEIVKKLRISFERVRAIYMQSQFEVDDVLPNPMLTARLKVEKERTKRAVLTLEAERAAREKRAHERRLLAQETEAAEKVAREKRRERMGTSNLLPEEPEKKE